MAWSLVRQRIPGIRILFLPLRDINMHLCSITGKSTNITPQLPKAAFNSNKTQECRLRVSPRCSHGTFTYV